MRRGGFTQLYAGTRNGNDLALVHVNVMWCFAGGS